MREAALLVCLCCTLSSCNNVERKAGEKLQAARVTFKRGDYSETEMQIDDIEILHPKTSETKHEGVGLMQQVELKEREETLAYLDSMLQKRQEAVGVIKGNYAFEKDAEYQRMGNYLHPSQMIKKNPHRSYLCFQVNENGVMSMTSIYRDPHSIHHLAMKVTTPSDSFVETPASRDSYETTDLGEKVEEADYEVGEDGNVIASLNLNENKNIRVSYLGERSYTTTMAPNDRKTVATVYELAQLLSAIIEIKEDKDEADLKIEFVKRKMVEREGKEKEQVLECRPSTLPL